jgi:steroid delta-isomerase-like uncharacterized protein
MTHEDQRAFFESRKELWRRRDAAALAAGHTVDGVVISPMFATVHGRAGIEVSYRQLFDAFPDWRMSLEDPLIDSSRTAQYFTATATHVGEFMGFPGSGRRFEIQGVQMFRMEGGLIAEERRVYDFTGLLLQTGILRGKPAKG